jgi:tetratricopeptide (TPR) repeat protein
MESREIPDLVSELLARGDFRGAEELLQEARKKAIAEKDNQKLSQVLSELIEVYSISDPPVWSKAEALSRERESLSDSAYSRLQTAMILHHGFHDYSRVVAKLQEAIAQGRRERDDRTVYTSLGLLGEAHLQLGRSQEALGALSELEQMVASRGKFVVGDETCFLEELKARGIEVKRVARLAGTLASVCRDPEFKERLGDLAVEEKP